jgi:hypothetical protein
MKYPALILVVAFMSSFASADDSVPAIQISNLPAGQTLNVFYANGRPAAISQAGSTPIIRSVYQGPNRTNIPSSGIINLPATNVVNNSLFWVTDYVVLAVNSGTQPIYINNSDGSVPSYPAGAKAPTQFTNLANVRYIHLTDYNAGSSISFDFSAPLQ